MKSFCLSLCAYLLGSQALFAQTLMERYRAALTLKPEEGISFSADTTTRLANAAVPAVNLLPSGAFVLMGSGMGGRTQATTFDGKTFTARTTASGLNSFADGSTIYLPDGRMRYIGQETSPSHTQQRPRQRIASWISSDGLAWVKEAGVRFQPGVADDSAAGVPYCLQVRDSTWRLYYIGDLMGNYGKTVGRGFNGVRTAISNDWGLTFTSEKTTNITREGDVDPHVVYLTNGRFRMYLKSAKTQGSIIFFEGTDGVNFDTTKITEVIKSNGGGVSARYDPFVMKFPDGRILCFLGTDDGVQGGRQKIIADVGNVVLTSVAESLGNIAFRIMPNPAQNLIVVHFTLPTSERVSLKVFNILGQEIAQILDETLSAGEYEKSFVIGDWSLVSGTLFVQFKTQHSKLNSIPLQVLR
jgi:hypothetical protein